MDDAIDVMGVTHDESFNSAEQLDSLTFPQATDS
jgi:hypothetical protein